MGKNSKPVKLSGREKRKFRLRRKIRGTDSRPRLCVFRSGQHLYAQLISDESKATLACASTKETDWSNQVVKVSDEVVKGSSRSTKSVAGAVAVGMLIADRAKDKGVSSVVFDRNGYIYHGRIAGVADGARLGGLKL